MKTVLCTLYNSYYLDKGLVLYDSLMACCQDFILYVLCMDDKCYEVLSDLNSDYMIPIRLKDFEDEELMKAKSVRSFGEYCWTCTPSIILYVIEKYNEPICTYVDADMYFYQDPQILIDEMMFVGKSVLIIPHRFTEVNKNMIKNGIYCVEFNTFMNTQSSLEVLKRWRSDCLKCCTAVNDGIHFGDQKYMDVWPEKYECVFVCPHLGAGVAPWNIQSYKLLSDSKNIIQLLVKHNKTKVDLIFYHFQQIVYLEDNKANINVFYNKVNVHRPLVKLLYSDYLHKIKEKKEYLFVHYNLNVVLKSHPAFAIQKGDNSLYKRLLRFRFNNLKNKLLIMYNLHNDIMIIN